MGSTEIYTMLVTVDVATEKDAAWNEWYNIEHVPDILKCPGFNSVRRFRSLRGNAVRYFTLYEIDNPDVVDTKEFAAVRGWYQFGGDVIDPRRSVYVEIFSAER